MVLGCELRAEPSALVNVLEPADTSSPRSTFFGFLRVMDERYGGLLGDTGFIAEYLQSTRLFPAEGPFQQVTGLIRHGRAITAKYLDLSALPPVTVEQASWRLTIQLKEILDRIDLPPSVDVPDAAMMQSVPFKRWTVPGSEIRIGLVDSGPRAGEYLFTQETIRQIPMFFDRIRDQPYRGGHSPGMYDFVFGRPSGLAMALHRTIPLRWLLSLPNWTTTQFLDQPLWRWVCIVVVFSAFSGTFWLSLRLTRRARAKSGGAANAWSLLPALSILLLSPATDYVLGEVLFVSPRLYGGMTIGLWVLFYLALTWLAWVLGRLIGEGIINFDHVRNGSMDAQLIRLGVRLIALVVAVGIVIEGANRVGLPSYSVLAGLGIGGLAMALAGQQALANLFGSLIIMFEKPFRIGHSIRTGGIEGRVEDIGFRSTRLRTSENTLMIVPSSDLIRQNIENLTARKLWRVKRTLYLSVNTPVSRLREFRAEVELTLHNQDDVKHDTLRVVLTQIGRNGFELLVDFAVSVPDDAAQLRRSDQLLTAIAELAERHQVAFNQDGK